MNQSRRPCVEYSQSQREPLVLHNRLWVQDYQGCKCSGSTTYQRAALVLDNITRMQQNIGRRIEELGIYSGGIVTDRDAHVQLLCEGTFLGWSVPQHLNSSISPSTPAVPLVQFNSNFPGQQHSCRWPALHVSHGGPTSLKINEWSCSTTMGPQGRMKLRAR